MTNREYGSIWRVFAFSAVLAASANGQTITGSIVGTVMDPSGSSVAGAEVTLTAKGTGVQRTAKTETAGGFAFNALEPGVYSISIAAQGFKKLERGSMNLTAGERLPAGNLELQVGNLSESVTVRDDGAVVQTASAEHSGVLTRTQVDSLMIKGRNIMSLLQLLPGAVDTNNPDGPDRNFGIGLNINGNRRNATGVSLDGIQTADSGTGWIATLNVSMDAVSEVKVLLNNYQAEYGRMRGAGVLMVGRSGTREFHGSFSYFKRHEQFNANNFFNNRNGIPRGRYRYNTYSYNVNGPVFVPGLFNKKREKFFFSWTQEYWPQSGTWGPNYLTVPTSLERQGDFSQSKDQGGNPISPKDPLTGAAFPNRVIPLTRIDPNGQALLKRLPAANFFDTGISKGNYNYVTQGSYDKPQVMHTLKVDYHISQNDRASVTWSRHQDSQSGSNGLATGGPGWDLENRTFATRGNVLSARYQKIITPTLINELVVGYNWRYENETIPDDVLNSIKASTIGFNVPQPYPNSNPGGYLPDISFGGGGVPSPIGYSLTAIPRAERYPTHNITDNLSKNIGSHTIKTGFFFNRGGVNRTAAASRGSLSFSVDVNNSNDTGNTWANANIGTFASYSQQSRAPQTSEVWKAYEWFVQDSWKATRRLTLEVGLRFAVPMPGFSNHLEGMFDPTTWNTAQAIKLIQPTLVNGKRMGLDPLTGKIYPAVNIGAIAPNSGNLSNGIVLSSTAGRGIVGGPGVVLQPRFGFAWDILGDGKTAVRGGYGSFASTGANGEGKAGSETIVPLVYTARLVYGMLSDLSGGNASGLLYPGGATSYRQGSPKFPVSHQFNLSIQRNLGWGVIFETGYVGNLGSHLNWQFDYDPLPVGTNFNPKNLDPTTGRPYASTFLRKYTGFDGVNYVNFGGSSNYHSLQTTVNRRFAKGLQLGGAWTWSKWLDTSDFDANGVSPFVPARIWNYGLASPDRTHNVRVNVLYEVPKLTWNNLVSKWALGGWSISGITAFISGAPFNPSVGTTDGHDITGTPSAGPRIQIVGNPVISSGDRTFDRFFNTAAFALPAVGTLGNGGRNYLRGPGTANWDLSVYKDFPIREPLKLQFRCEAYNVFNHTQFSGVNSSSNFNPAGVQVNGAFGQINGARTPRQLQLALRFLF